ncbi:MAG: hypothetical protein L0H70_09715, partial [Xanthomonadales bacterium]|nr:hypothetical protein [Xanthomonadales bacterium]
MPYGVRIAASWGWRLIVIVEAVGIAVWLLSQVSLLVIPLMIAALQPVIPMKFVTWAAGIVGVPIWPFLGCIAVGRGKRVYLLTGAIRLGGERAEAALHKYIEWIGWGVLVLIVILLGWWWLR